MINILKSLSFANCPPNHCSLLRFYGYNKVIIPSISAMSPRRESSAVNQTECSTDNLPKLPVPALQLTVDRLKTSAKPFAKSSEELQNFNKIVDEFSRNNGIGSKLQSLLELKASKTDNWLSHDWWVSKAYLEGRDPIIIWSNPGLIFPHLAKPNNNSQLFVAEFISRLIAGVIDFRNSLKNGINPELVPNKVPKPGTEVCMDQYTKVFGTSRKPGDPTDFITFGNLDKNEISIIISRLNKFYKLSLNQSHNIDEIFPDIKAAIIRILSESESEAIPVGSFTALPRNDFTTAYRLLDQNHLKAIEESEFVVNIDHISDDISFENTQSYNDFIGKQILHSDINNIGNRWFDKTVQLIVVSNKEGNQVIGAGFCYEHTPAEGPPIVKLMEHTVKHLANFQPKLLIKPKPHFEELKLIPDSNRPKIEKCAEFSIEKYSRLINSLDLEVLEFKNYGKDYIKSVKYSPDSWIQVAINLAYYRTHGEVGACYESASTRKFAFGRTDTIRSLTNELYEFFRSPNFQTLNTAIESHKNIVKNALNGNGIDRLFLGYNCVANELKSGKWKWGLTKDLIENPLTETDYEVLEKLCKNELYLRSKHYKLSTSQVATIFPNSFMCYGPLVYDGYGCCYNPSKNQITFGISAFKENNANTNTSDYKRELENSLNMMNEIVTKQSKL